MNLAKLNLSKHTRRSPRTRRAGGAAALGAFAGLFSHAPLLPAQTPDNELLPKSPPVAPAPPPIAPARTFTTALLFDVTVGFVPYVNDLPLMVGVGVRFAGIHELWARAGYMPLGDDVGYGFGCAGYRVALRPRRIVRPILGGLFAGLHATCGHDALGQPSCTSRPLVIVAATAGVRIEPLPWLGLFTVVTLGVDSYPNPFGMLELGMSFALPLS